MKIWTPAIRSPSRLRHRVRITHRGKVIATPDSALALKEASYPVVHYIPREDVDFTALTRTDHSTHCPYKGDAAYYSVEHAGGAPKMRSGPMRRRFLRSPTSPAISPSIPNGSTGSSCLPLAD